MNIKIENVVRVIGRSTLSERCQEATVKLLSGSSEQLVQQDLLEWCRRAQVSWEDVAKLVTMIAVAEPESAKEWAITVAEPICTPSGPWELPWEYASGVVLGLLEAPLIVAHHRNQLRDVLAGLAEVLPKIITADRFKRHNGMEGRSPWEDGQFMQRQSKAVAGLIDHLHTYNLTPKTLAVIHTVIRQVVASVSRETKFVDLSCFSWKLLDELTAKAFLNLDPLKRARLLSRSAEFGK